MKTLSKEQLHEVNVKLLLACHHNEFLKAKEAIDAGADVNVKFNVSENSKGFNSPVYKIPLIVSIQEEHEKIVELLLKNNVNPDVRDNQNRTALMHACGKGLLPIAQLLVDYKANINATNELGREIYDWNALTWGIRSHIPKIVDFLIANNVIVDKRAYEFAKNETCICVDKEFTNAKIILSYLQKYVSKNPINK